MVVSSWFLVCHPMSWFVLKKVKHCKEYCNLACEWHWKISRAMVSFQSKFKAGGKEAVFGAHGDTLSVRNELLCPDLSTRQRRRFKVASLKSRKFVHNRASQTSKRTHPRIQEVAISRISHNIRELSEITKLWTWNARTWKQIVCTDLGKKEAAVMAEIRLFHL